MPGKNKPTAKKHKFVKDGVFYAELNSLLARELAEDGYGGCEVRVTPTRTEVIIRATKTVNVVGPNGRRIKELTALVQKRFKFEKGQIVLFAQMVKNKGLSALAQAEAVRYRLFEGLSVRRAAYSVLKFIMDRGAKGVEVTVSGKLRGQRAKSMKFRDGYMLHAGDAVNYYIDSAVKHVLLRQGVIGIKVKIMLPHDPNNEWGGPAKDLPDVITIHPPKELEPSYDAMAGGGGAGGLYDSRHQMRYGGGNIPSAQDIDASAYAAGPLGGTMSSNQAMSGGGSGGNTNVMEQQQQPPSQQVSYNDQYNAQQPQGGDISYQQPNQPYQPYDQQDQSFDQFNQYQQPQPQQQQQQQQFPYDYSNAPDQGNYNAQQFQGGQQQFYNQNQPFYNQNQNPSSGFRQY